MTKKRSLSFSSRSRDRRGSMLILIVAVTIGLVLAVLFFMMSYVRMLGTQFEQRTAIEAAALAAAKECSNVVILNNQFGYVGLSDSAPDGTATAAGDNYYTQVHGVNTIIGTTLLDYIIATQLGNAEMQALALQDLNRARTAANQLVTALQDAITVGGSASDKDGNTIRPYVAAEQAYTSNQIRMTGSSSYQPGSLQLSLGVLAGGAATNIKTPTGWAGSFASSATVGQYYKSYVPVTFNARTWVFAGVGDSLKLVDPKKWAATASGVPWQHPTVILAQAVQDINDNGTTRSVRTAAAAQPASVYDPRPNPGALVIAFPDGPPDGACAQNRVSDLYGGCLSDGDDDSDMYVALSGDYPVDPVSLVAQDTTGWPIPSDTAKQAANACKIAVYDWIRRAGTKANVGAVVNMHSTTFNPPNPPTVSWPPGVAGAKPIPNGVAHIFRFNSYGNVTYQSKEIKPAPFYVVSENQALFESFEVLTNGAASDLEISPIDLGPPIMDSDGKVTLLRKYDLFIRDYARKPSVVTGGQHAGEPIDDSLISRRPADPDVKIALSGSSGRGVAEAVRFGGLGARSRSNGGGGGSGALPMILPQEDFAFSWNGTAMQVLRDPTAYKKFKAGSGTRSTYLTEGTVCEIRFRRQVKVQDESTVTSEETIPVVDPTTGEAVIDPVTGLPTSTTTTSTSTVTTKNDVGYIGLK
ncbi:MAG: hypothetical protein IPM23_00575 [Candidatus Melainabacteria bacterium]|nr:hypothetical protein [Candidatus Melainabacteria bacterium]